MTEPRGSCVLISASCTTGWLDWVHGELWACDDGLLRRPLGLRATIAHSLGDYPKVSAYAPTTRDVLQAAAIRGYQWIAWEAVQRAVLRSGPLTDSIHIALRDGSRVKFLWYGTERASEYLQLALPPILGDRLASTIER